MQQTFELIAKTFQGLEEVLAQELIELGADDVQIGRRMVSFSGNQEMMYRANFCLRTAVRVLKPILHFRAKDAEAVYKAVKSIEWNEILDLDTSFAVDTTVYSTEFRNSKFVAYKVKDAIVDYFMELTGKRPNISVANPDIRLNMHISEETCTLSLDSSGESLHLRGYREATVEAPINEVLAAAIVKMSGWDFNSDFIDPFCGSGTILVEAALMARNIYPGIFRRKFAFENWKDFNPELLSNIFDDDSHEREFNHKIYGFDLNLRAIEAAQANAKAARVDELITFEQRDIRDFVLPEGCEKATIVTNPPYGERLRPEDLSQIYRTLGMKLKKECQGCTTWVISSKEELFDDMRLRASFRVPLNNGSLDCELRKFITFDGKLEDFRAEGNEVKTDTELQRMGEKGRFRDGRKREFSRKRFADDDRDQDFSDRGERSFNRERKSFDRERKSFDKERKPLNKDRKPFDRDRKSFDRKDRFEDRRPRYEESDYRSGYDFSDDPELAATYRTLRARHDAFEGVRAYKERFANGERKERGNFERRDNDRSRGQRDDRRAFSRAPRREDGDFRSERRDFKPRDHKFERRNDRDRKDFNRDDRRERRSDEPRGRFDRSQGRFERRPRQEGGFSRPPRGGNFRKRRED